MHPSGTFAVIPARLGSTRFPAKPLIDLDGAPMIVRVADRAKLAKRIDRVIVATDHQSIADVVTRAGHRAVMTPVDCASGTDRVAHALREESPALVVNVQGDEPLIDPADLDALVSMMIDKNAEMGTLARALPSEEALHSSSAVKVVTALDGRALYFSRAPLKHARLHVGIYAYTPSTLQKLARLERTPLELAESLEQLRALENGIAIHVAACVSARPTQAIDTPEDVDKVLRILRGTN